MGSDSESQSRSGGLETDPSMRKQPVQACMQVPVLQIHHSHHIIKNAQDITGSHIDLIVLLCLKTRTMRDTLRPIQNLNSKYMD